MALITILRSQKMIAAPVEMAGDGRIERPWLAGLAFGRLGAECDSPYTFRVALNDDERASYPTAAPVQDIPIAELMPYIGDSPIPPIPMRFTPPRKRRS